MIKEEVFSFRSNDAKTMCHGVRWIPEGEVKAVLQICHGMAEYIERYREFAVFLAEQGILVTGHDHLGHGRSVASDQDLGFFAEKDGNMMVVRDIHRVHRITRKLYPDVPYFLFGHSMGSFLARQYLGLHGDVLTGAIICGTGGQSLMEAKAGMSLARSEAAVFGWRYRSKALNFLCSGSYNSKFKPNRTEVDWLSVNTENVDRYIEDPKCGFVFTLNGYYNMFLGMAKIQNHQYLESMPKDLPLFFIAGEQDPVGNFGKGVKKVVEQYQKIGMKQVECRLYPDMRHEILNEDDREQVFADVLSWLENQMQQQ